MKIFISGGCKNGKSSLAQQLAVKLSQGKKRYYLATMIPCDGEDLARIRRHRADRDGLEFETVEAGRNICAAIKDCDPAGSYLLDSVTALLLNELYPTPTASEPDPDGALRCRQELLELCDRVENAVFVSDHIYADGIAYDAYTENYRRSLAWIDRALAARCDTVLEVMSGNILLHKGELP